MSDFVVSDAMNRLLSFHRYPIPSPSTDAQLAGGSLSSHPSPLKLAEAGFYRFPGCRGDEVECFCCGVRYSGWKGQSPLAVHRILSHSCPHVLKMSLGMTDGEGSLDDAEPISTVAVYTCHQRRVNDRQNYSDDGSMYFERHRLLTFPSPTNQGAIEFAQQGFLYVEDGSVRCVFCKLQLSVQSEYPTRTHEMQSPNCPFVRKLDVGNIPLALEEEVRARQVELIGRDGSCNEGRLVKHPQYSDGQTRLDSYRNWPVSLRPSPHSLALAGFFYTGYGDKVRCYFCGVTLLNWRVNAHPWSQHARQAPNCDFVRQQMGNIVFTEVRTDVEPQREDARSELSLLRPSLDMDALQAAMNGFYPDKNLLLMTLQAIDLNFIQLQRQGDQLFTEKQLRLQIEHLLREVMDVNELERAQLEMRVTQQLDLRQAQATVIQHHTRQLEATRRQLQTTRRQLLTHRQMDRQATRLREEVRRLTEDNDRLRRLLEANNIVEGTAIADADTNQQEPRDPTEPSGLHPQCTLCYNEKACIVFYTCGHLCGNDCSRRFLGQECPFCRQHVVDFIEMFSP